MKHTDLAIALSTRIKDSKVRQTRRCLFVEARVYEVIDVEDLLRSAGADIDLSLNRPDSRRGPGESALIVGEYGPHAVMARLTPKGEGVHHLSVQIIEGGAEGDTDAGTRGPKFLIIDEMLPDAQTLHDYLAHRFHRASAEDYRASLYELSKLQTDYLAATRD